MSEMLRIQLVYLSLCLISVVLLVYMMTVSNPVDRSSKTLTTNERNHNGSTVVGRSNSSDPNLDSLLGISTKSSATENPGGTMTKLLRHMLKDHKPDKHFNFGYNVSSLHVPLEQSLPDVRSEICRRIRYNMADMPYVSIVSIFHNEALTMLLRHVHVLLKYSPPEILTEIILVDDFSSLDYLGEHLEQYLNLLDKRIKLIRNSRREGLVRSRLRGARIAKGEAIVFLDSHMRCSPGWLEPLVYRLKHQPNLVLQPHVPSIRSVEAGRKQRFMRSGFGWDLRLAWYFLSSGSDETDRSQPFPSITLAGCAIAVNKKYFFSTGGFDPELEIWGGEHFDLAFKAWMCGGRVETVPCSVVGHLYRMVPYSFGKPAREVILKNLLRVADTWMDDLASVVRRALAGVAGELPVFTKHEQQTIKERKESRTTLQCKDFRWFLKNVAPEIEVPSDDSVHFGEFLNINTSRCLTVVDNRVQTTRTKCDSTRIIPENNFTIDRRGRFRYKNNCIGPVGHSNILAIKNSCDNSGTWTVNRKGHIVYRNQTKTMCLTHDIKTHKYGSGLGFEMYKSDKSFSEILSTHEKHQFPGTVRLTDCRAGDRTLVWNSWYTLANKNATKNI